jgi:integrase
LREIDSVSARCLEFTILTAARSGEVLRSKRDGIIMGERWKEIDFDARVWTVPAVRMKGGEEHRVPLTERALAILEEMGRAGTVSFFPDRARLPPFVQRLGGRAHTFPTRDRRSCASA